ncbi:uncharacterized protein SAPINGB_P004931 [Magnusiomyces paraingens]|uniref:SURP motif domain-containing protein n=1 Tax=Magnusiomyces paraingens TaxID=2606893 RepID=A0A5E8BYX6_9ASCO|nr:uncharacterized protein SAPINGB_P004931 [Saprochaete ingens]VVT56282.1 unnamed protein product [Saprochaete ingens]
MTSDTQPGSVQPLKTVDGLAVPANITIPPPEVRTVVEKTAAYVVRNGRAFEARIRENEQENAKFNFIKFNDPYFAFYEWRLKELETGGPGAGDAGAGAGAGTTVKTLAGTGGAAKDATGITKPEPLEFAYTLPPLSAQDLDIIKLTALYVARNGTQFQTALARAEAKNFQYDFLRPQHSLFPLYNSLVEQYKSVITPPAKLIERIKTSAHDPFSVINRARIRAEWDARQATETEKAAADARAEREAYANIDWHDFVVVETIKFTDADERNNNLPAPLSRAQLEYASLEQKRMGSLRIEEAPPDFVEEQKQEVKSAPAQAQAQTQTQVASASASASVSSTAPPVRGKVPASLPNTPRPPQQPPQAQSQQVPQVSSTLPPGMKIKSAGTSRLNKLKASGGSGGKDQMVVSPLTGELVPQSQLEEHMRISLMDPKWKEQKTIAESRQATTNLSTAEVTANIKRLVPRDDDEEDAEDSQHIHKRARDIQWDGYSRSKDQVRQQAASSTSAQQKLEAKQREMERLNKIGPRPT